MGRKQIDPEIQARIVTLHLEGSNASQISKELAVSSSGVRACLVRHGVYSPVSRGPDDTFVETVLSLFDSGLTYDEITHQLVANKYAVAKIVLRSGRSVKNVKRPSRQVPICKQQELIRLFETSERPVKDIAAEVGVSASYARRMLRESGKVARTKEHLFKTYRTCKSCKLLKHFSDMSPKGKSTYTGSVRYSNFCVECRYKLALCRKYNIDPDEYSKMLVEQGQVCCICKGACKIKLRLAVDHNHETGAVRGLLCQRCNSGLGHFGDSITRLKQAIKYLEDRGSYGDSLAN
jgi:AraC-like DNA-binding protein